LEKETRFFGKNLVSVEGGGRDVNHVLRCSGYELVKTDMVRGSGCYLYDAQGKRYVDLEAGVWCTALGHNHPRVNQAIRTQLERIAHIGYRYTDGLVEEAAMAVLGTVGLADGTCVFLSSGSEAVEFGVQIARRITGQPLLLTLADSYLAAYGSAGRRDAAEWHCFDWSACAACPHPDACDPECEHLRGIPFERIGGFVFEPGSTSGLVRFPPRQLVQALAGRVKRQQGLLVVDEVTTGLGRTGAWYGFEHYGLRPDVVALGKGLGNGYPVSAVAMAPGIAERLESSGFHYAQSHQNDPLGCAVAREVVTVMAEDGLVERSARVGTHFLHQLERLGARHASVKEIRGRGLMIAVEFGRAGARFSLESVYRGLVDRGFLAGYKPAANLLRFYPPLTIGEADIAGLVENLDHILEALA
jgi:acetylornithine/N-succinyldiaminopimelate aminotransferase